MKNLILEEYFFKGVPIPVGASMALLPIIASHEFGDGFYSNPLFVIGYVAIVAVLMVSRVPTVSIKKIPIKNEYLYITLVIFSSIIIGLLIEPWLTLTFIGVIYAISIPISVFVYFKIKKI